MEIPTWLSKLLLFASILTAVATTLTDINPVYGVIALGVAGLVTAFADGFRSFILPKGVTFAGLLLVGGVILGYVASPENSGLFSFITPAKVLLIGQVGVILTTIGKKLQDVTPETGGGL